MHPASQRTHNGGQDEAHDSSDNPHDDRDTECPEPAHLVQAPEGQQPNEPTDQGREEPLPQEEVRQGVNDSPREGGQQGRPYPFLCPNSFVTT